MHACFMGIVLQLEQIVRLGRLQTIYCRQNDMNRVLLIPFSKLNTRICENACSVKRKTVRSY